MFDQPEHADTRAELERLVGREGLQAAARTTLNAHYTDPRLADALWRTVDALGVTNGTVLEPGCGSGEILAAAPTGFTGVGVELDPTTARVARARLAAAGHTVIAASFADVSVQPGSVDAVVGNVPFGRFALYDAEHNPTRQLSIHDHFLAKSIEALTPGGVAAVITSRFTLDARTPAGRMALGRHADFLGAVRLPSSAHRAHAGTGVVTDIVVLRRRPEGQEPAHAPGFLDRPVQHGAAEDELWVSSYWRHHPGHIAGELTTRSSQFGMEVDVIADDWKTSVEQSLTNLTATFAPASITQHADGPVVLEPQAERLPAGRIDRTRTGVFRVWTGTAWESHSVPSTQRTELAALLELRDGTEALVALESDGQAPDAVVEAHRQDLADRYRTYVARFGPINRTNTDSRGTTRTPRMGGFRNDPAWPRVAALEVYDQDTGRSAPADLLERRIINPVEVSLEATTPDDALAMSLHQVGRVDQTLVGDLLGVPADEVADHLGELVFRDPQTGSLVETNEYLSGNVREKLATAIAAAEEAPEQWSRNVEALKGVVPRDITADELTGTLGAPWVPPDLIRDYIGNLAETSLGPGEVVVSRSEEIGRWNLQVAGRVARRLGEDHPFGQAKYPAIKVLESALNGTSPRVTKTNPDPNGRPLPDPEGTEQARQQLIEMRDHFNNWLLRSDDDRTARVLRLYNERFNSLVPRSYGGSTVQPPGLNSSFRLYPHQHAAVARMIRGGDTLLAHPVGAGKTAEQIVGAMELRRLGVINRPLFVVPNHMLDQYSSDIQHLFPQARVLAMTTADASAKGRAAFAARVRSSDWDAIVTTHSSFGRWSLSDEALERVQRRQVEQFRSDLLRVKEQSGREPGKPGTTLTKSLEKRLSTLEEKLKETSARIAAHQDSHALPFDHSGVDYLVVDELHEFKNLGVISSAGQIRGVPSAAGADMATDLAWKLDHLRMTHGPDRPVITGATGTPISNTVAEMWVMGRYIRPKLLKDLGLESFDAFRQQFCEVESTMELDDTGTQFRSIPRLARYQQLPELSRWWGEFTDMVRVEDLGLDRPEVTHGGRQVVVVPPAPGLSEWMSTEVNARAEAIRAGNVDPTEDNYLKLSSDLRLAAFDWAGFSGQDVDDRNSTLAAAADRIAEIHQSNADRVYPAADGQPHPRSGSFQLVFADLGVPSSHTRGHSAYERLRQALVDRGVPEDKIAFAGDFAKNQAEKERFFEMCRTGQVSVAISSTTRMGMGTNVQNRLLALHHLNAPWRPSDIEQREGRIIRQGNHNPEVQIFAYATERSASVTAWQTLERKAGFIGQVMRAEPDGPRNIEVADDEALSYGEIKALATGDPDFQAAAEAEHDLARLERLARSHARTTESAKSRLTTGTRELAGHRARAEVLEPIAARMTATEPPAVGKEPDWSIRIGDEIHHNRADAARAASERLSYTHERTDLGETSNGLTIRFQPLGPRSASLSLVDHTGQSAGISYTVEDRYSLRDMTNALVQVSRREAAIPSRLAGIRDRIPELEDRIEAARRTSITPFPHAAELAEARKRVDTIHARLTERYASATPPDSSPGPMKSSLTPPGPTMQPPNMGPDFSR